MGGSESTIDTMTISELMAKRRRESRPGVHESPRISWANMSNNQLYERIENLWNAVESIERVQLEHLRTENAALRDRIVILELAAFTKQN